MAEKVRDTVCGMEFDKHTASATLEYQGTTYYFCSPGCRDKFAREPEKYAARAQEKE